MLEIETKFRVLSQEFSLEQDYNPIETIKSRLKSMDSIVEKLQRKGLPLELESIENNLKDVAGIRVICPFLSDIYRMASCLMEQDDIVVIEKKDYIGRELDPEIKIFDERPLKFILEALEKKGRRFKYPICQRFDRNS